MKRLSLLAALAFAQLTSAPPAAAGEGAPPPAAPAGTSVESVVQRELINPLAAKDRDRSRFSRAPLPAQERRVRVLDEHPQKDASGAEFYTFAVDARHGVPGIAHDGGWQQAAITGCVYVEHNEVFVKKGDRFRPAAFLLGKNLKPAPEQTCVGASEVAKAE
jgi:hypothetical protein